VRTAACLRQELGRNAQDLPWSYMVDRNQSLFHKRQQILKSVTHSPEYNDPQLPFCQVLLVFKVLVTRYENGETRRLRHIKQRTVLQTSP